MSRIQQQNEVIKNEKRTGIMTHVIVGYPSLQETEELVCTMAENGADFVELQIPFSDPVADGPTILQASQTALDNGTQTEDAFTLAKNLRKRGVTIPLLFMTYANIVLAQGISAFIKKSKESGIDGFIIPDLPFDTTEGKNMYEESTENGLEMIPLYAPTMNDERYELLANHAQNIVYAVSRTGVTGTAGVSENIDGYLAKIKNSTTADIALGFGIQSQKQITDLYGTVNTAVIGSHLVRVFEEKGKEGVADFLRNV